MGEAAPVVGLAGDAQAAADAGLTDPVKIRGAALEAVLAERVAGRPRRHRGRRDRVDQGVGAQLAVLARLEAPVDHRLRHAGGALLVIGAAHGDLAVGRGGPLDPAERDQREEDGRGDAGAPAGAR